MRNSTKAYYDLGNHFSGETEQNKTERKTELQMLRKYTFYFILVA